MIGTHIDQWHRSAVNSCTAVLESCSGGSTCAPKHFLLARPKFEYYQHKFSQSLNRLTNPRWPRNTYRAVVRSSDVRLQQWDRAPFRSLSSCTKLVRRKPSHDKNLIDLQRWEKSRDCATRNSFVDIFPTVPKDRKLIISTL